MFIAVRALTLPDPPAGDARMRGGERAVCTAASGARGWPRYMALRDIFNLATQIRQDRHMDMVTGQYGSTGDFETLELF
jgi:hypothetical protein